MHRIPIQVMASLREHLMENAFCRPQGVVGQFGGRLMSLDHDLPARVIELLGVEPWDSVLEVGSGPGVGLALAATKARQGKVVGSDPSQTMLALTQRRNRAQIEAGRVALRLGTADNLPFHDATFDKATTMNSLHLWPNPVAGLREVRRTLRPGGRIAVAITLPGVTTRLAIYVGRKREESGLGRRPRLRNKCRGRHEERRVRAVAMLSMPGAVFWYPPGMDHLFSLFVQAIRKSAPVAAPGYAREVSLFLDWLRERGLRVESATPIDLRQYLAVLTGQFRPSTAARKFSAIRRFYALLKEQGHVPSSPAAMVSVSLAAYRPRSRPRPTPESMKPIPTTSMQGVRDLAIVRLAVFGLSPAQLVALNVSDVDVAAQAVRLPGRSGRRRIQPLDPDTFAALRRWMALRQMLNPADTAVFLSLHWTTGRTTPHQRLSCRGLFDVVRRYLQ